MKTKNIVGIIARIIVGLVFIASAVTKYLSIDAVDLFVYEHRIFSWEVTTFVTRLLIVLEAFVGIMLIVGIYPKQFKWTAIVMLIGFSVYVILKPLLFNVDEENCHCFGTVLLLNDRDTLIKNVILLVISYFMFWNKGVTELNYKVVDVKLKNGDITQRYRKTCSGFLYSQRKFLAVVTFIVLFVVANMVFMPEPISRKLYPKTASIDKDKFELLIGLSSTENLSGKDTNLTALYNAAQDSIRKLNITQGNKILCLYSTGCKYCKRASKRLDVVRQKYNIADSSFAIIFWGNDAKVDSFFVKTNTKVLPHTLVSPWVFLPATKGKQPVIALMKDGSVEKLLKYPNINEKEIYDFMFQDMK